MKKLILFSLLSGAVAIEAQNAGSALSSYTDIMPDTLLNYVLAPYTNETYSVNIFPADAMNDIELTAHGAASSGGSSAYIKVTSINPNVAIAFGRWDSVFTISSSTWNVTKVAKPLALGAPINGAGTVWDNTVLYLTDQSGSGGGNKNVTDWVGGDKYLGLKYQNGSNITYGWLRVRCKSKDSCYVKDFSSGAASTGIKEQVKSEQLIYPNPVNNVLYIKDIDVTALDLNSIRMIDLLGNEVSVVSEIRGNQVTINLAETLPGCYIIQYSLSGKMYVKKIIRN
ncbi:MAG: T9SS type A sorting domain-containing protein [Bacteroidetes bacterium]|nr:T9SS type A sorting domain-containing protein [Bacteroidota bacterium]